MTAVAGAPVLGVECKAYTCPDLSSPVWTEVPKIQGLSKTQGRDVAEVKERALLETTVLVGHATREISFQLTRRPGNTQYDAIQAAFESRGSIALAIMNGDITTEGVAGYQAEFKVTQFDDNQEHGSTTVDVTIRPAADYTTAPAAVVIAGA